MRIGFEQVDNGEGQRDTAAVAALAARWRNSDIFAAELLAGVRVAAGASDTQIELLTRLGAAQALLTQAGAMNQPWWNAERATAEIAAARAHIEAMLKLITNV